MAENNLELGLDITQFLKDMKRVEEQLEKHFPEALKKAEQELEEFEEALEDTTKDGAKQLKKMGEEADKFGKKMSDSFDESARGAKKFQDSLSKMGERIKKISARTKEMAGSMRKAAGSLARINTATSGFLAAGLLGFGAKEFMSLGANYERAVGKLRAVSRSGADDMLMLRKAIRDTGATTSFTATQTAEAAANLAAMGMPAKEVAGNLKLMVQSANALQAPIEDVSRIIKQQQNVFQVSTKRIADTLTGAYTTSSASIEKLDVALRMAGQSSKQAGLSFEETIGTLSYFIDRGATAERAGTALRGVIARLARPTTIASDQMKELGVNFDEIKDLRFGDQMKVIARALKQVGSETERNRILMNLFDIETAGAAGTLLEGFMAGRDVVAEMAEQVGNTTTAMEVAEEIASDFLGKLNNLASAAEDRLLEAFQLLEPVLSRAVGYITDMIRGLSDEDMADGVRYVVGGLLRGAEAFYNLIATAINGIASLIHSGQMQRILEQGGKLIDYFVGGTPESELQNQRDLVAELEAQVKADKSTFGEVGNAIKDAIIDGAQAGLEGIGVGGFNLGMATDSSASTQLERERKKLAEMEKNFANDPNAFKAPMGTFEEVFGVKDGSWVDTLLDGIDAHTLKRNRQKNMNVEDATTKTPTKSKDLIDFGDAGGLDLARDYKAQRAKARRAAEKAKKAGDNVVDPENIPDHILGLIPDIEAFYKMSEEHQKSVLNSMAAAYDLTSASKQTAQDQANAMALIAKSAEIQAEHLLKPASMQQQLVDNLERVGDLYKDAEDSTEVLVGLQQERVNLEKQWEAAMAAGQLDHARALHQQLDIIHQMSKATTDQGLKEAQNKVAEQARVDQAEKLVALMEDMNKIDTSRPTDENYLKIAKLAEALAAMEAEEQGTITKERRAQLDAIWKALGHTEHMLTVAEEAAKINLGEKWLGDIKKRMGFIGDVLNNPEGFKELGTDLAQGAKDAYKAFNDAPEGKGMEAAGAAMQGAMEAAPGGPKAMAANAIMKLIQKLDVFNEAIELTLGNNIKMLNAIFSPLTNAMKEVNKALEPVWQALGELSTVLFDAFSFLKPLVAVIKGFARILTSVFKGLASGLKPLTHAMNQLTRIIESIFGGFGGGSFGSKIEDLESALSTVRDALEDMKFGDMNPADAVTKLNDATAEYAKLRDKAFGENATNEDIEKFTQFAQTYLGLSQEVNKSSSQYVKDFEKVQRDLTGLEGKLKDTIEGGNELDGIGAFIDKLLQGLIGFVEKIAQAIVDAVKMLLQGAVNLLAFIAQAIIDKIREALQGAWDLLAQIAQAIWDAITKALQGAWDLLTGIATAVWDKITEALQGAWNMLTQLAEAVWGVVQGFFEGSVGSLLQQVWDAVWGIVEGMFSGSPGNILGDLLTKVWDTVVAMFTGYFNLMEQFYQLIWDVLKGAFEGTISFLQLLYDAVAGAIKEGFTAAWNFVELVWDGITNALTTGFDQAFNFVAALTEEVGKALKSGFEQYVNFLTSLYEEVGKALSRGFSGAVNFIEELFEQVIAKLAEGFTGYVNFLKNFYKEVYDALAKGFDQAWNFFTGLVKEVLNALARGFDQPFNFLADLLTEVIGALQRGFAGYISFWQTLFKEVVDALARGFAGYHDMLTKLFNEVVSALSRGFTGNPDFLSELFREVVAALQKGFSGTISFIQNMIDGVTTFIQKGLSGSFDFANVVMSKIGEMLRGGKNLLQLILDKIMTALGLKGQSDTIPILPNPLQFLGGPKNFLELEYSFAKGGQAPSAHGTTAFQSGGLAVGPSHQSGMLGLSKSGDPFLFEGQEFIINKKTTELLGSSLLGQINDIKSTSEAQALFGGAPQPEATYMVPPVFPQGWLKQFDYGGLIKDSDITPPPLNKNSKSFDSAFYKNRYINPQTSGGKGDLELLHLNNPLSVLAGPDYWYVKLQADLLNGKFDIKRNIFADGGKLGQFMAGETTIPQFDNGWMLYAIWKKRKQDEEAAKKKKEREEALKKGPPVIPKNPGEFGFKLPPNPQKSAVERNQEQYDKLLKAAKKFAALSESAKLGQGFSGIEAQKNVPLGGTLADPSKTKPPPYPSGHSFNKGMGLKLKGGLGGWPWEKELFNIKNPFTEEVQVIVGWVTEIIDILTFKQTPIKKWVDQLIGPERLKLSIQGKMLDFWNSRLSANFGGDLFKYLGIGEIPLPDFLNVDLDEGWKSQKKVTAEQLNQNEPLPKPKPLVMDGHLMRRIFPEIWGDEPTSFSKRFGSDANAWIRGLVDPGELAVDGYSMEQFQKDLADAYNYNDKYVLDRDTGIWYERGTTPSWLKNRKNSSSSKNNSFNLPKIIDTNVRGAVSETEKVVNKAVNTIKKVFGWEQGGHLAQMANGGLVMGSPHAIGGRAMELEGGEFVMRKEAVQDIGQTALDRLNRQGTDVFNRQLSILERIEKSLSEDRNGRHGDGEVVVNVYTDMSGTAKAAIDQFRTEIKQRAQRVPSGSTREDYVPMSVL